MLSLLKLSNEKAYLRIKSVNSICTIFKISNIQYAVFLKRVYVPYTMYILYVIIITELACYYEFIPYTFKMIQEIAKRYDYVHKKITHKGMQIHQKINYEY